MPGDISGHEGVGIIVTTTIDALDNQTLLPLNMT